MRSPHTPRVTRVLLAALLIVGLSACEMSDLVDATRSSVCSEGKLPVDQQLQAEAQVRADRLASTQVLAHTVNLFEGVPSRYKLVGENVGTGQTLGQIAYAFIGSAEHLANICDPSFIAQGDGVATDSNGRLWVAEVFGG